MKTERMLTVIETHSSGETTKVVTRGFPKLVGNDMWEKTLYCQKHYDHLRKALMMQPRGFSGILGAIITEPTKPEADYGVIFMYTGGYFRSCGDSTFSVVKVLIEQGMIEPQEPFTEVTLDTAAGLVKAKAEIKNGNVGKISFQGPASFFQESTTVDVPGIGKLDVDIAFGGLYYGFVDPAQAGVQVAPENAKKLVEVGMKILEALNSQIKVKHPENPEAKEIELVTFAAPPENPSHHAKHANVYANTICVSPAGTSVSAKLATLYAKNKLGLNQDIIVESLVNPELVMIGKPAQEVQIGEYKGVIPELSAYAYIIGIEQCIIEPDDPIKYGFLLT